MNLHGRNLTLRMYGEDVRELQRDLAWIGKFTQDPRLRFQISSDETRSQLFGESTRAAVQKIQLVGEISASGVVDEEAVAHINKRLSDLNRFVRGHVRNADGTPVVGASIRVLDQRLREEHLLGQVRTTNQDGYYEDLYTRISSVPNIIVKAFTNLQDTEPIAFSEVRFEAGPDLVINLVVGETEYRGLSDYELMMRDITPLVPSSHGQPQLADLVEDEKNKEVTFLSRQSRKPVERLTHLVLSHRHAKNSLSDSDLPRRLDPEVFYGFMSQGLPTEPTALLSQDASIMRRALKKAVKDNIIPPRFENDDTINATLAGIKDWRADVALEDPPDAKQTTLGKLVKSVLSDTDLQHQFMRAFADHSGPVKDFWAKLELGQEFPTLAGQAATLKLAVALANVGQDHIPLVNAVRESGRANLRELASLNEEGWLELINKPGVGVPDTVQGEDPDAKARTYARILSDAVEATLPNEFFAARLHETEVAGKDDLLKFVENPDFDIRTTRPEKFLNEHPDVLNSLSDKDAAVKQLKGLQRVYRLQPSVKSALALQQTGKDSAQSISSMGQNDFVATYAQHFSNTIQAKEVYAKARHVNATAIALVGDLNPAMGRVGLQAVPDTVAKEVDEIPQWSSMFDSFDFCSCGHCQSVYSPAAYLVDLLHFLNERKAKPPTDPDTEPLSVKKLLFDRRPDLGEIELTCENTNTTLPYIDLVLEVLEDAVATPPEFTQFELDISLMADLDAAFASDGIRSAFSDRLVDPVSVRVRRSGEWWVIDDLSFSYTTRKQENGKPKVETRSRQTIGTTGERRATPQYRNDAAYTELSKAVYPWNLPFDRSSEEASVYLKHLGVSRHDLIGALSPESSTPFDPDLPVNILLAAETLGLTDTERRIIVNEPLDPPRQFQDHWHNATVDDLKTVRTLLDRSGVTYEELEALLSVRLLNPANTLKIVPKPGAPVDTCDTENLQIEFLDQNVVERLRRFVRLLRKLRWSIPELGDAIDALFGTAIDLTNDLLVRLTLLVAIRSALRISVSQTLELLGIGPEPLAEDVRQAALAKYLRVSSGDFGIALELLPQPFTLNRPDTLRFVEIFRAVQASGFTFAELHYLIRHKFNPASPLVPTESSLSEILKDIRASLLKVDTADTETMSAQVIERVAATLALPLEVASKILSTVSHTNVSALTKLLELKDISEVSRANAATQFETLEKLVKIGIILKTLNLPPSLLDWFFSENAWLVPAQDQANTGLKFDDWSSLIEFQQLRRELALEDAALEAIITAMNAIEGSGNPSGKERFITALEQWLGWRTEDIETLIGKSENVSDVGLLKVAMPVGYAMSLLVKLNRTMKLLSRLGVSAQTASAWCNVSVTSSDARAIRDAAKFKYENDAWHKISTPLQNALRDQQREALMNYLAARNDAGSTPATDPINASDLYAHFLIDVEMSSCMLTSRIKQAISSVQLFVQRCSMNLESEVVTSSETDDAWNWWKWMKNYRLWEANTKVFLYPENWIEPELRDDKTPFFKELESELMEGDLTRDSAEKAFQHYLDKLGQVARLEVMGVSRQKDSERDVLHVFARSQTPPYEYYYRQRVNATYWTPLEKIDLDIEGEHLIPVVWNNRLFLFWPIFLEKSTAVTIKNPSAGGSAFVEPTLKYWELKLAWSERKQGRWTTKRMSSQFAKIGPDYHLIPTRDFFFSPSIQGEILVIDQLFVRFRANQTARFTTVAMTTGPLDNNTDTSNNVDLSNTLLAEYSDGTASPPSDLEVVLNRFSFEGCDFDPTVIKEPPVPVRQTSLQGTERVYMSFQEKGEGALILPVRINLANSRAVLAQTPGKYRVITQGAESNVALLPFFFQDPSRNFLIVPDPSPLGEHVIDPSEVGSGGVLMSRLLSLGTPQNFNLASTNAFASDSHSTSSFVLNPTTKYTFHTFYHPHVSTLTSVLTQYGLAKMLSREVQRQPHAFMSGAGTQFSFQTTYAPEPGLVGQPYPIEELDFRTSGPYSIYNWELFFHAPLLIADRLMKNQRFEEAAKWFHYIFNPTDTSSEPEPARYWQTKEFFEKTPEAYQQDRLRNLLELLARANELRSQPNLTPQQQADLRRLDDLEASINAWKAAPFKPHLVARTRTTAYQKTVVMKYIDNLIAWGDQLFRRDTLETLNEATQLYVLAADILGPRPVEVQQRFTPRVQTYNSLEPRLGELSSALVELEELIPAINGTEANASEQQPPRMLYFCLPKNDKLLGYWDTVADRLFKIRHCLNIEGIARQLPLFEPPIDPALLVRGAAAGLDLTSFPNDVTAERPGYRFNIMAQKATELCGELKALGSSMLATLEKRDAEELSLLRVKHETSLLELIEQVREQQLEEANASQMALQKSRELAVARYLHYQRLLGIENPQVPPMDQVIQEVAASDFAKISINEGIRQTFHEASEGESLESAADWRGRASWASLAASFLAPSPDIKFQPFGTGGSFELYRASNMLAVYFGKRAEENTHEAGRSSRNAQYVMRTHDWTLQNNLAAKEIMQIDKQMLAAEIRSEIARLELRNHRRQVENAREVEEFMRSKYTTKELYSWMVGQMSGVYFQAYQLAYEISKRAESCYQHELAVRDTNFIKFGYWDSLKKGLLAGEKLHHDLKRMEVAYLEANKREYELTKHVSLVALAPEKFLELKETGVCDFKIPEWLFDMETPGNFMRRLKMVSITVPCVTGPYTGIHVKLQLGENSYRQKANLLSGDNLAARYLRQGTQTDPDQRFFDNPGNAERIVTSTAQNDAGVFEPNLRDERYLPFEGAGAISDWRLELPKPFRTFDYNTISDVILHLRYTAQDSSDSQFAEAATASVSHLVGVEGDQSFHRLFSLRHEFPSEWHRFVSSDNKTITVDLATTRFPYFAHGRKLEMVARAFQSSGLTTLPRLGLGVGQSTAVPQLGESDWVGGVPGLARGKTTVAGEPGSWTFVTDSDPKSVEDVFIVVQFTVI